jgi:hypothetical protein
MSSDSTSGDDLPDPNPNPTPKPLEDEFASVALAEPHNEAQEGQEALNGVANGPLAENNHREIESGEREGEVSGVEERIEINFEVEEARESVQRGVVWRRTNSEVEVDGQSSPSSSGYAGERGSTSASSGGSGIDGIGEDEIQEVENEGSISGFSDSPATWVPGKRHLDEVLHFGNFLWILLLFDWIDLFIFNENSMFFGVKCARFTNTDTRLN